MSKENLELWSKVEKTNPKYTKKANVKGNNITSIAPQFQIMNATEHFGIYGQSWGFKSLNFDYSLKDEGLVSLKAVFFFPKGEFEIINSISIWRDNAKTKIDDNFAKKLETDALTKALSKLGFNADIFMGKFDDVRYVEEMKKEFAEPITKKVLTEKQFDVLCSNKAVLANIVTALKMYEMTEAQRNVLTLKKADLEKSK
jgi:hypothetical protein